MKNTTESHEKGKSKLHKFINSKYGVFAPLSMLVVLGVGIVYSNIEERRIKKELYHQVRQVADIDGDMNTMLDKEWAEVYKTLGLSYDSRGCSIPYVYYSFGGKRGCRNLLTYDFEKYLEIKQGEKK